MSKVTPLGKLAGYLVLVVIAGMIQRAAFLEGAELAFLDVELRWIREAYPRPAANDVTLIAFDEQFISDAVEPFALFHPHLAAIFQALRLVKPKLVAFDIALPEKSFHAFVPRENPDYDFDQELLRAIGLAAREFPVILARTPDESGKKLRDIHAPFLAAANRSPFLPSGMAASGSAVLCNDRDESVRRYPDPKCAGSRSVPPLAAVMAAAQGNRQDWHGLIDFTIGKPLQVVAARDVISALKDNKNDWLRDNFAGRVVLVGSLFRDEDRHLAPVSLSHSEPHNKLNPGLMLQAQVYRSLMNHGLVTPLDGYLLLPAIAASVLFWFAATTWRKLLLLLIMSGGAVVAAFWLLTHLYFLPVMALLMSAWCAFALRAVLSALENWHERRYLEATFSGYVSPQLMRRLRSGEISPERRGTKAKVCVLFSDICGFTKLSETLPPEQVVEVLNEYFAVMTAVIHRHGGVVDKFIGDGIMALFGQPEVLPAPEKSALEAAHEMRIRLSELNRERFQAQGYKIESGIGIHSGEAILGFLGSKQRHDFTAIGDTVNAASRLEGLTRGVDFPIVCSAEVASAVGYPDFLIDLGMRSLKGHTDIHVYGWKPCLPAPINDENTDAGRR